MDSLPPTSPGFSNGYSSPPQGTKDRALIIEDNEGITSLLSIVLGNLGLKVVACQSGREALVEFALHRESLALVYADCRLPDGDGRMFCQQMRAQQADLPLLLSSGSATGQGLGPITSDKLVRFLPKPYSPKELMDKVRWLQDEAAKTPSVISAGFV